MAEDNALPVRLSKRRSTRRRIEDKRRLRVGIYTRISRNREGRPSLALDRQEAACRRNCEARGWDVVEVYRDDDLGAYSLRVPRPDFERSIADLEAANIDVLMAWKADRLVRRVWEWSRLLGRPDDKDPKRWSIVTVEDGLDTSTALGRVIATLLVSMAEMEAENIGIRTHEKHKELARVGRWSGGGSRAFGHRRADPDSGDPPGVQLVAVPEEADVLRETAERLVAGETLVSIVRDLNARGKRGAAGGKLLPTVLRRSLMSARIVGRREIESDDGTTRLSEIPESGHAIEPLLSEDLARAVWGILAARSGKAGATVRRHLLTGFVRCAECGAPLRPWIDKGRPTWACLKRADGSGCGKTAIPMEPVEAAVVEAVLRRIERSKIDALVDQSGSDQPIASLVSAIERDEAALDRLAERLALGTLSEREHQAARRPLVARLDASKRQLASARAGSALNTLREDGVRSAWARGSLPWRRELLGMFLEAVTVGPGFRPRPLPIDPKAPIPPARRLRPEERLSLTLRA